MGLEIRDESESGLGQILKLANEITRYRDEKKFLFFDPIQKQMEACNSVKPRVAIFGGNRVGKTKVNAFFITCHLTGIYPDWWTGKRYKRPVEMGIIGKSNRAVREVIQTELLGPVHNLGTGMIPKTLMARNPSKQQGVPDMVDTIFVKHSSGGVSTAKLFSTEMKVSTIMGQNWDFADFDEEPTKEWFDQGRMRVVSKSGQMFFTFTPEEGYTEVINEILEMDESICERITITIDDAEKYYPPEERARLEKELPEWQKEFRFYGRPSVGEKGRVFKFSRDSFVIDPMDPEPTWRRVAGLDVGYGHATCALDLYIDDSTPEATFYVLNEYYSKEELPDIHAAKLRTWGDVDFFVDPSAKRRSNTDGRNLYTMYEERGLSIFMANNDVDASILLINQLLANRQLFISSECTHLIDQMGLYRRVIDKKTHRAAILKRDDDAIDPLRYAIMAHESARVPYRRRPKPWEVVQKVNVKEWKPFNPVVGY